LKKGESSTVVTVAVKLEIILVVGRILTCQTKQPLIKWCWHWMVLKTNVSHWYVFLDIG